MSVELRVPAVFLKLWAFRTQYVASFDRRQLQLGPLLVGCCPELIPPPTDRFSPYTTGLGCALLAALLAGGYATLALATRGRSCVPQAAASLD